MPKDKGKTSTGRQHPQVGDMLFVPVDANAGGFVFQRPLIVTSVGAHQLVNGYFYPEPGEEYHGQPVRVDGVSNFLRDVDDWRHPDQGKSAYTGK